MATSEGRSGDEVAQQTKLRNTLDIATWEQDAWGNLGSNVVFLERTGLLANRPRVLEIGCGTGGLLRYLDRQGLECVGVDIDAQALARCGSGLRVLKSGGDKLPFLNDSFDLVLSFDVFEHIPDSDAHLREVGRVLRPGGHYALQTPNILTNVPFEVLRTWKRFGFKKIPAAFRPPEHCALHSYWGLRRRFARNAFSLEYYDIPVANKFFVAKVERYTGKLGTLALKFVNPDKLPIPLRTNFYAVARLSTESVVS